MLLIIVLALGGAGLYLYNKQDKKEFVCLNGQTAIYEYYKNAVVLVDHKYSYKVSIKHGKPFSLDVDNDAFSGKEINGTGFFVSRDGRIVTNRHVVQPWSIEDYDPVPYLKEHIASILPDSVAPENAKAFIESHWEDYEGEEEEEPAAATVASTDSTKPATPATTDTSKMVAVVDSVQKPAAPTAVAMIKEEDIEITPSSDEISVAFHGSSDNWWPCKMITFAKEDGVDIGVLQLEAENTPEEVLHIVDLKNAITDDGSLKPGNKAVLIGYPMGTDLANTRKGIMVQAYEGQINKESDGISIQYNVTSTHGASGSPVFNECGQLIAVNYAGMDQTQGYNFGIVAKYALKLVK